MPNPYARGAAFEGRIRQALEAAGWLVLRSAGSHTPVDLVAWGPHGQLWLIQAKASSTARPSPAERLAWLDWSGRTGGIPVLVTRGPRVGRARPWVWQAYLAGAYRALPDPTGPETPHCARRRGSADG